MCHIPTERKGERGREGGSKRGRSVCVYLFISLLSIVGWIRKSVSECAGGKVACCWLCPGETRGATSVSTPTQALRR